MKDTPSIKARTRKEIAGLLGMSTDTLRDRLKENHIEFPPRLLTPQEQKLVFKRLWYPSQDWKEAFEGLE